MDDANARKTLAGLIHDRRDSYDNLSRLIGRNPAYIQQYIHRGTPRRLAEQDRRTLARYFGVSESLLGAPDHEPSPRARKLSDIAFVPRLALGASAGAGSLEEGEGAAGALAFDPRWLRDMGVQPDRSSIIKVDGESMMPTLGHGDDIMVDHGDGAARLRDGIYVLRFDGALMVKRIAIGPALGRFSVLSDNPVYPRWNDVDPAMVEVVGRVVWTGRRVG